MQSYQHYNKKAVEKFLMPKNPLYSREIALDSGKNIQYNKGCYFFGYKEVESNEQNDFSA
jgi:hypothetical protein